MTKEYWQELQRKKYALDQTIRKSDGKIDRTCAFATLSHCEILDMPYCKEDKNCRFKKERK